MDSPSLIRPFLLLCAAAATAFGLPPVIDPPVPNPNNAIVPIFPVGKTLILPITATDPEGDSLSYKVTSSNAKVTVRAKTGEPTLKMTVTYGASAQTGVMEFALFREFAPVTTGFIGGFAQAGYYDGLKFHRVVKDFVIQGGDPAGTGSGFVDTNGNHQRDDDEPFLGLPFNYDNEFQPGLIFSGRGQLAMANAGYLSDYSASNGSQFFVTLGQPRFLDFKHTIFGQMLRGWTTLDAIANVPVGGSDGTTPTDPVTITEAKVEPNNHDAVLIISATDEVATPVTITVTANDGNGGVSTQSFLVLAVKDEINDPPVLLTLPPFTVPKETQLNFLVRSFDLEQDYLFINSGLLGTGSLNATDKSQGGIVRSVQGKAGFEGQIRMGLEISQYNMALGSGEQAVVQSYATVGIGDLPLFSDPVSVKAAPTVAYSGVVARFKDLDTAGSPTDFTTPATNTTINWGDGSALDNGAVANDPSIATPGNYAVTGTHTYAKAGVYTIVVTATGNKGAVGIARTQAVVSANTIVAVGQHLDLKGATASNRVLATFSDTTPGRPREYKVTVDWGDGVLTKGAVTKLTGNNFAVRGTHTYKDAEPFAISVQIEKTGATDAVAWSTVNITNFNPAPHMPPFQMVHLIGAWNSGPSKQLNAGLVRGFPNDTINPSSLKELMTGGFFIANSGNKPAATSKLRFLLSKEPVKIASFTAAGPTVITTATDHGLTTGDEVIINGVIGGTFSPSINGDFTATVISATQFSVPVTCVSASVTTPGTVFSRTGALAGATQLTVNALPEISFSAIPAGAQGVLNFTIGLPNGNSGTGRYLLSQFVYSDPIIDASKVYKVVVSGPISGVYGYDLQSDLGFANDGSVLVSEDTTKKATFKIVLDTAPTADVVIPIESSLTSEGTVDKATLTFTPANWFTSQTVTVKGADDAVDDGNKTFTVTVKTPISTDVRFSGSDPIQINFLNIDND